jgi:6-pyruvoyl-tetrahydropterin synthase
MYNLGSTCEYCGKYVIGVKVSTHRKEHEDMLIAYQQLSKIINSSLKEVKVK